MAEKTRVYEDLLNAIENLYHVFKARVPLWQVVKQKAKQKYPERPPMTEAEARQSAIQSIERLATDLAKLTQYWDYEEQEKFLRTFYSKVISYMNWFEHEPPMLLVDPIQHYRDSEDIL